MAVAQQRKLPLQNARQRRAQLPRAYFKLGDSTLLVGGIVIVCLLSILFLAQTGVVSTAGYELQELKHQQTELIHEGENYEYRIAKASQLDSIAERAAKLGLRPAAVAQQRYVTIEVTVPQAQPNNEP